MSILYGFDQADASENRVSGEPITINTPNHAIAAGIGMVHQHFMPMETFSVLETIIRGVKGAPLLAGAFSRAHAERRRL